MAAVLVLEAFGVNGPPIVEAATKRGFTVIVASHKEIYDNFSAQLQQDIDELWAVDFRDPDVADDLVRRAFGRDIAAVVTGWEFFTPLAATVASRLGLPANDPERVSSARNKKAMAHAFRQADVRHAATRVFTASDDVVALLSAEQPTYPLVVKPADNAGSCGVSVVHDQAALRDAVTSARAWPLEFPHDIPLDPDILVQDYIGGQEYSIETIAVDGEFTHVAITEKITTAGSRRAELGHIVPARIDQKTQQDIGTEVAKALTAVGFRWGVSHTEIKVDGGQVWVIETGVRPGGDLIPNLVRNATGIDLIDAYIIAATGRAPEPPATPKKSASVVRFIVPPQDGTIAELGNLPTGEDVVDARFTVTPGTKVGTVDDNISRLGHYILVGDDAGELATRADELLRQVEVRYR